uniref:uncharacterized protein LOC105349641 isoform X2 n=1 Tax=Fragaria vesca subsp. vesca TaxID=101020 RepID=UPI0005C9E9E5|nr:PREDICTED: uncharacterized protein LOC105349641 isoform X2 [Fragaria vesca subsp. vesca]
MLLSSSTVRGVVSRLNLPFLEVYSDGRTQEVGHLGEVLKVEEDEECVAQGEASNNKRKLRHFKPKTAMSGASLVEVQNSNGVLLKVPPRMAESMEKKKRKAASNSGLNGDSGKKSAQAIPSRRSRRIANMVKPDPRPPVYVDLSGMRGDDSEDDASLDDNGNRTESLEDASCKDDDDQTEDEGQTGTPANEGKLHSIHGATSMDHDHNVNESNSSGERDGCSDNQDACIDSPIKEFVVVGTVVTLMKQSTVPAAMDAVNTLIEESVEVNADPHGDNRDAQYAIVELVLPGIGEKHEPHPLVITYGSKDPATLISERMPSCAIPIYSSAPDSGKARGSLFIDLETRFSNFVACFDDMNHRSSITIDSIAQPLSGDQSSFEGSKVPLEFMAPLTNFVCKHDGGNFSNLLVGAKSARQKQVLTEHLGQLLHSMESKEVSDEETFLIWRDACRDMVDWGLNVGFICDHLKKVAKSYFGLKPAGLEDCCREIQ